jgi:hypothetical protein
MQMFVTDLQTGQKQSKSLYAQILLHCKWKLQVYFSKAKDYKGEWKAFLCLK